MKFILFVITILILAMLRTLIDSALGIDIDHAKYGHVGAVVHVVAYLVSGGIIAAFVSSLIPRNN